MKNKLVSNIEESLAFSTWKLVLNTCIHMLNAVIFLQAVNYAMTHEVVKTRIKQKLHAMLLTAGYQILMMEAIMTFNGNNSWSRLLNRPHKKIVHMSIQLLACALIIVGFALAVVNKDDINEEHFVSAHSILGLIAFVATLISMGNGFLTFFIGKDSSTLSTVLKIVHNISGVVALTTGLCSLVFGFDTIFFRGWTNLPTVNSFIIFVALTMFYILINPMKNLIAYVKSLTRRPA